MNKYVFIFLVLFSCVSQAQDFYIVKWTASWCGPCKQWNLNERSKIEQTVQVIDIDIDKYPKLAKRYNIKSVPTFFICGVDDRMVYTKHIGYTSSSTLTKSIKQLKDKSND